MTQPEQIERGRRDIERLLALCLGAVLGFGVAAGLALALLLAGQGARILGPEPSARLASGLLILLSAAASLLFAKMLRTAMGAGERDPRATAREPGQPSCARSNGEAVPRWLWWCAAAALALFLAAVLAQSLRAPDGAWDAWSIWNARARALLRSAGDVRLACAPERGQALFALHPDYPLLLPTVIALGWHVLGSESALVPLLASLLPALLAAAIAALTVARSSKRRGVWIAAILLTTPELVSMAAAQYAEAALGALVVAGSALLVCAWRSRAEVQNDLHANYFSAGSVPLVLAGLAFGLAASVKHEGALFLVAAAIALGAARPRDLLPFALGAALPLALLTWFDRGFAPPGDLAPGGLASLIHRALMPRRAGEIALALLRRLVYFQSWALYLAAFVVALGIRWHRNDLGATARRLLAICALVLLGFLGAYLTTPHELAWHLRTSLDRLLLQLWPTALLAFFL